MINNDQSDLRTIGKSMEDNITKIDSQKLVDAIVNGKNVKAHKMLEKILQKKCAKKIKSTLEKK